MAERNDHTSSPGYDGDDSDGDESFWVDALEGIGDIPDYILDADLDALYHDDDLLLFGDLDEDGFEDLTSESTSIEADEDHNKIFVSLQDSHVLRRLVFHKTTPPFRLPRILRSKEEKYEDLFHLLEELELLLRVWKRRVHHPFTAHLEVANNRDLKYGVDYSDHDMEHESDCEETTVVAQETPVNETLTKKKYCQSTKLFHEIFGKEGEFEKFCALVRKVKKYIYRIILGLFKRCLPPNILCKLPDELWEKVWKHCQEGYAPDGQLPPFVGTVALHGVAKTLENARIRDLFGSVGNLHMLIFEILYKHPYIVVPSPMVEICGTLPSKDVEKTTYSYYSFKMYEKMLRKHFARLHNLGDEKEGFVPKGEASQESESNTLTRLIDDGLQHLRLKRVKVKPHSWSSLNEMVIASPFFNDVVAFLDKSFPGRSESEVTAIIWDVNRDCRITTVQTDIDYLSYVYGRNENHPEHLFSLSRDRFAFLRRSVSQMQDECEIIQWSFDRDSKHESKSDTATELQSIRCLLAKNNTTSPSEVQARNMIFLSSFQTDERITYIICHQNPYGVATSLRFFDGDTGTERSEWKRDFPGRYLSLKGFKAHRVFLQDETSKVLLFCNVTTKETISAFTPIELCKDAGHEHDCELNCCQYQFRLDQSPDRNEFVLFSPNFFSFQLFRYETSGSDLQPLVIASGSTTVYDLCWMGFNRCALSDGCVFFVEHRDVHLRAHTGDYFNDSTDVHRLDVLAFNCFDSSVHSVAYLTADHLSDRMLMNTFPQDVFLGSQTHFFEPYFSNARRVLVLMPKSYLDFQFCLSHAEVRQLDTEKIQLSHDTHRHKKRKDKRIQKYTKEEIARARDRYVNKDERVEGKICKWKENSNYGFIKTFGKEVAPLGNIFVHISDIIGQKHPAPTKRVKFFIISQPKGRIKATNVEIIAG